MFTTASFVANEPVADGYTMTSDAEMGRRLVRAFDSASDNVSDQTLSALRDAAIDFVGGLKNQGLAPERVIVALKTVLRARDRSGWGWIPSLDVEDSDTAARHEPSVYARLFTWCVEAYYDDGRWTQRHPDSLRHGSALMSACPPGL